VDLPVKAAPVGNVPLLDHCPVRSLSSLAAAVRSLDRSKQATRGGKQTSQPEAH
jgi:hypothetical protein